MTLLFAAPLGCTELAKVEAPVPTFTGDVAALLAAKCVTCHGEAGTPPNLTSFVGVADCRADGVPWATPGDAASPIVAALARPDHATLLTTDEAAALRAWVVAGGAAYDGLLAHEAGWALPSGGAKFHGKVLAEGGYAKVYLPADDEESCAKCHGKPAELGGAVACARCHGGGNFEADRCDGCHGANGDPKPVVRPCDDIVQQARAGAHVRHVTQPEGSAFPSVACTTCHVVPETVMAAGHLDSANDGPDVRFEGVTGTWDAANKTCAVGACHGNTPIEWKTATATVARCDTCHGNPPESHVVDAPCTLCHGAVLDAAGKPSARTHLDGIVQVARECTDCHAMGTEPVFAGNDPGAHRVHLTATRFARALECTACHAIPTEVTSPGHIDTNLPADFVWGAAATAGGKLAPAYDGTAKTCANAGCHGTNLDGGPEASPAWSATATDVECGNCHALPPVNVRGGAALHPPSGEADCGACHSTEAGDPISIFDLEITEAGKAVHIDGCVQLAGGDCP